MSAQIRANSILPAHREDTELETADGLTLVGELAKPLDRDPVATLVCLHPLPTHGGMMDSHVFRKAAWRLPALAGVAVLRFNTRGTGSVRGTSEGAFSAGVGERFAAAPHAEVLAFDDAKHLWVGDAEKVLDEIVRRVAPSVAVPLPREWEGPMETADTSAYADRTTAAFKDVPMPE